MLATSDQRRVMGQQDLRFALAVLKHDPAGQLAAMAMNTLRQLAYVDYDGLNQDCFKQPGCWDSLPPQIRETLRSTPSGRGLWPQATMNLILYAVLLASIVVLATVGPAIARLDPERWRLFRTWLIVGFAAMLVCAFFGGAVAEPQYRYQGRLIWLLPLAAGILLLLRRDLANRRTLQLS